MRTLKASEFKAKCLALMDEVARGGEEVVITKNGVPVSKLVPVRTPPESLFGRHRGRIASRGDVVGPVEDAWEAEG
ncbi:type II toxin-antitoxin system Phd/YefM family antitoxin [Endothiovibrio diazotrophicus]